jgi:NAD+ diphosphatase
MCDAKRVPSWCSAIPGSSTLQANPMTMTHPTPYTFIPCLDAPACQDDSAYWFAFQGDRLWVYPGAEGARVPRAADFARMGIAPLRRQYLGYLQNGQEPHIHCYAVELDPEAPLKDGLVAGGLRELHPQLDETFFKLAGRAVQVVDWDRSHQYCGRCGTPTEMVPGERARRCPDCGQASYPRIAPAIIIAVVRRTQAGNRLLMARNHRFPPGRYSVVAGFVEPGESLEEAARREVWEEVGIQIQKIRYFGSQPWPFPHSLMVGFTAEYAAGEIVVEEAEIADAQWFAPDDLPGLPPPMSIARRLIDWFVAEN